MLLWVTTPHAKHCKTNIFPPMIPTKVKWQKLAFWDNAGIEKATTILLMHYTFCHNQPTGKTTCQVKSLSIKNW
jgi:hypothetical protein